MNKHPKKKNEESTRDEGRIAHLENELKIKMQIAEYALKQIIADNYAE